MKNFPLSSIWRIWPEISYRSPNRFWGFLLQTLDICDNCSNN
ncbi:hypothetical protein Gotri_028001 [Gossypium trilobum]|uniref:Uncharacterized protein n=1 Tax=Gossypium trilobum TaxID=34281 RepID=A0A7J9FWJ7_9ROSI|nr:hypothetical protein [Gossypium trilobum]